MKLADDRKLPAVCPGIRVVLSTDLGNYVITVSDNGPGILPENIHRIWKRGFSTFGTSGIGLSSMKNEVETRFNGRIEVYSEPAKETRFLVYIPLGYISK
jgi:sensor histidine kinase regulating citrate/malate metabolism